jgi:acetyltransferase-like isoleucine patch superfamily enzyme
MKPWVRKLIGWPFRKRDRRSIFMKQNELYEACDVGEWTFGRPQVSWGDGTLRIGRFCSIGDGVKILTGSEHHTDWLSTYPFHIAFTSAEELPAPAHTKGNVTIGHDVWIGNEAMILSGVTIGNGAVIAARAVVTRHVPAYAVVAGVPARVVRYRFDEETIRAIEKIAWWDWPVPKIEEALPLLQSPDTAEFIRRYGNLRVGDLTDPEHSSD